MKLKFIVMATLLFFIVPKAEAQSCTSCDVTLAAGGAGDLNIPSGKTYCLPSGTYNASKFSIEPGGTLCISAGATFTVTTYNWESGAQINGSIINRGTITVSNAYIPFNAYVENYGTFTLGGSGFSNYSKVIINRGTFTFSTSNSMNCNIENYGVFNSSSIQTSGTFTNDSVATFSGAVTINSGGTISNNGSCVINGNLNYNSTLPIINHGYLKFNSGNAMNCNIENDGVFSSTGMQNYSGLFDNYGVVKFSSSFTVSGGTINNSDSFLINGDMECNGSIQNSGYMYFKKGIARGSGFNGTLENSGTINFSAGVNPLKGNLTNSGYINFAGGISGTGGLSANVKNYGYIKVSNGITIGDNTFLTNDSTIEINSTLAFHGPKLTNNGKLIINNGGDFTINNGSNGQEAVNNGSIVVSGDFEMVVSNSKFVNNCNFKCGGDIFMGTQNTTIENNGLLWTTGDLKMTAGATAVFKNGKYGFVRGVNFKSNQGNVSGLGKFYFTGNTTQQNGWFNGDSAGEPIQFYATQVTTPGAIFSSTNSQTSNVVRPSSMTLLNPDSFNCSMIPPTVAGNAPTANDTILNLCSVTSVTFQMDNNGLLMPYDNTYKIIWSSLVLLPYGGNTPTLTVTLPEGTFTADTVNKKIKFTPVGSFTGGTVKVQFRADDMPISGGMASTSLRGTITIKETPVHAPDELNAEGY